MLDDRDMSGWRDQAIAIHGAREHNLKNVSLTVPRGRFVVVTGVSGSGKSTLAFDLLFAEGQRRDTLVEIGKREAALSPPLSNHDLVSFFDRMKLSGELEALRRGRGKRVK